MTPGNGHKDLLGKTIRRKRPKYEAALERHEIRNVPDRAERIRWLSSVMPQNAGYMMPLESSRVFQEAKDCFVYGQLVATMVLAASFIEHWLTGLLNAQGQQKVSSKGLAAIIEHCRDQHLLPAVICDKVDSLRQKRNPFVHLKGFDHPHGLGQRMLQLRSHPDAILEADAKDALVAMYSVAVHAKAQV